MGEYVGVEGCTLIAGLLQEGHPIVKHFIPPFFLHFYGLFTQNTSLHVKMQIFNFAKIFFQSTCFTMLT